MTSQTLRTFNITGTSLTGSDGDANRTYTLPYSSITISGFLVWANGVLLHPSSDYSLTNTTLTFLNAMFDVQVISGQYYSTESATTNTAYATVLQLVQFCGLEQTIPNVENTTREVVGTGDATTTRFWLDKKGVIDGTLILSYGASEASLTQLTETTHYTVDYDKSLVSLTVAGLAALGSSKLYAEYSYNTAELVQTQLADALNRAEDEIDNFTNNHFANGSATTPDWNQHLDEGQDGKGLFDRNYFQLSYPIPNLSTTLNGAVLAGDTTIDVVSTDGFPSSGYILVESDKIAYTGKTSTSFTGCSSVEAHATTLTVKAYVVEMSTTEPGGSISWDVLEEGTEFEVDRRTGRIHLYASGSGVFGTLYDDTSSPPNRVANRVRMSYLSGESTIPDKVEKATLILASKEVMGLAVRKAHSTGLNKFNPSSLDVDKEEYEKLLLNLKNDFWGAC